jgi:hypothetical protein
LGEIREQSCHGAARIAESRELGTLGTKSGGLVMSPPDPLMSDVSVALAIAALYACGD